MDFSLFKHHEASSKSKRQQRKDEINVWIVGIILVMCSTLAVVYFMPRSSSFNYEYQVNEPWRYGALFASQKFNIQMSDSAIQAKQDSVRRSFQPYFNLNSSILPAMRARLLDMKIRKDDGTLVKALTDKEMRPYVLHVAQLLDTVYMRGLISPMIADSLRSQGVDAVRFISGNVATSQSFARVFSTHSAYQYIMHQDPVHYKTGMLTRLNINTVLEENAIYDAEKSQEECDALVGSLSVGIGFVKANEKIVDRGEVVTPDVYLKLKSYEAVVKEQNTENAKLPYIVFGQVVFVLFVMTALCSYLALFRHDYLEHPRCSILLYALISAFSIIASLQMQHHFYHIFVLPCCMVPIIIRVFLDSRTAFIFHCGMVLLISFVLNYPYEFVILQVVAGMVAIQNLRELSQRSQIIRTAVVLTLTYAIVYMAYNLTLGVAVEEIDRSVFVYFLVNGVFLLFSYPLLWIFERSFGFISDVTLVELSNINNPLLQRMTEVAPGTFQHSMQVANLASEVAKKIKARVQLVRTGALYHDIGKMERPVFFTENQSGANPHKHLTAMKSAEVIIRHVTRGVELAGQYNLPEVIKRFILTHHGRGKVKYFYNTYCNEHPGEKVDESLFTYPGPNPTTKEEAILMMCDSVEAASRSLPEYTEESISNLVDRIVDSQVADGFFIDCDVTFRDIAQAKAVLKERLKNVYHTRISYPELQQGQNEKSPEGKAEVAAVEAAEESLKEENKDKNGGEA